MLKSLLFGIRNLLSLRARQDLRMNESVIWLKKYYWHLFKLRVESLLVAPCIGDAKGPVSGSRKKCGNVWYSDAMKVRYPT
jgi:hypothetical protein